MSKLFDGKALLLRGADPLDFFNVTFLECTLAASGRGKLGKAARTAVTSVTLPLKGRSRVSRLGAA